MIFHSYIRFFTIFSFLTGGITAQTPSLTLENLHVLTLNPAPFAIGQKAIADWFELIKKEQKIPAAGIAFVPTNKLSSHWQFKKGIPKDEKDPIFIHSAPRDDFKGRLMYGRTGHGLRCTSAWLKNSIINGSFITFDYFFDGQDFDLGQGINVSAFKKVYEEIAKNNPQAPLVIAATCIGAKIALEFAASSNTNNVKAMILESPFIDVKKVVLNLGKNYLSWIPFADKDDKADIMQSILQWYAPDCKKSVNTPPAQLKKINSKIPIFIAHLKNDSLYSDENMYQLVSDLRKNGNTDIYLLVLKDSKTHHGHLNQKKEFAQTANAFLAHYNLPHNAQLAKEGKSLLAKSLINAQATSPAKWHIVVSEKID